MKNFSSFTARDGKRSTFAHCFYYVRAKSLVFTPELTVSLSRKAHFKEIRKIVAIAIIGQSIVFSINLILARNLAVTAYEDYVVAAALFLFLQAIAAQGVDKYTLRFLPAKFEKRQWDRSSDFMRFALSRLAGGSILVALLALFWAHEIRDFSPQTLRAVHLSLLALPVGVLTYYQCAVLSATGDCVRAAAVTLLIVPALALLLIALLIISPADLSGAKGIACWAIAWCIGFFLSASRVRKAWPHPKGKATAASSAFESSVYESDGYESNSSELSTISWRMETLPFWLYRLSMGVIAQVAVLVLDWLQPSAAAVGAYAAAMSTATLASVLAVSTNRIYARELSVLMEMGDYQALNRLRIQRLQWLLPVLVGFVLLTMLFTEKILALFHPEFVAEGSTSFRLLVITSSTTVLLATAPIYLKYRRQYRVVFSTVTASAVLQITLLVMLVPRLEATGAAIAYTVSMLGLYGVYAIVALRQLRMQQEKLL
ncbi:lipopolysaccharide biosynthesis protein [Microbulbifer celer]|uniref:Lipopolysaccharide biosynthesis protein n=1 Tax=Microbulbifer celer TaxID=435905 RepID=A0ABW3UDN8_9GAMM|nr:hypothetical protein [Microbulbifer celer]UFN55894.1 hypothetical protein LPW13_09900 [Microbulbifer celer]